MFNQESDTLTIDTKIENKSEIEIFMDYYKFQLKKDISDDSLDVIRKIIDEINEEENK